MYVSNPIRISSKGCLINLGFVLSKTCSYLEVIQVFLGRIFLYCTLLLLIVLVYVVNFISSNKAVDWNFLTLRLSHPCVILLFYELFISRLLVSCWLHMNSKTSQQQFYGLGIYLVSSDPFCACHLVLLSCKVVG